MRVRASSLVLAGALIACLSGPATASAWLVDGQGAHVPNTDSSSATAQLAAQPSVEQKLAEPGSPQDDDPDALAQLGPTGAPDDELGASLDRLAGASDAAAVAAARDEALAILAGDPLPGRPYSGIPLLNWNAPAKAKRVPAGGEVTVTQVRFGNHVISDTALLSFEDPSRPFTLVHRIAELGGGAGAELAPTPLLHDGGTPIGGQPSVLVPLGLPSFPTETSEISRFHPGGGGEQTRLAVQRVEVRMPPAGMVTAILDADDRPGHEALAVLRPATAERLAALERRFGFAGDAPSAAERAAAIRALGPGAPERQLYDALSAVDAGDVATARRAGADLRPLVGVMRTRTALPPGFAPDPAADVTVVLVNDEAYVSRPGVHLPAGRALRIEVINGDGFERDPSALRLDGRSPVFGALDLGRFDWGALGLGGPLAPGERRTTALELTAGTFALWLGDAAGGDQAGALLRVDRGPRRQSVDLTGTPEDPRPFSAPLGSARDAGGDVWTALAGTDELARVRPADDLPGATMQTIVLPGGAREPASAGTRLAPHAVAVDGRGIVWSTLRLGNAIARVDPGQARDGSADGVRVYPLAACTATCALTRPPDPPTRTRAPAALAVTEDGEGNTVLWFAEQGAAAIGALRVTPDGTQLDRVDFPCDCRRPGGIGLDGHGRVWFTEGDDGRIGRLTQDITWPWSATAAEIVHHTIPTRASDPRGLAIDRLGRVWFTEAASGRVGLLDPTAARPGTTSGIRELALGEDDFGARPQPHGIDVDRSGTAFWTDGFGDVVGSVTADGTGGALRPGARFRPAQRQSLLGPPLLDGAGDLWFAESAGGLLTRVVGVSTGRPGPAQLGRVEADQAAGTLRAGGLREMTSVDVRVARDGATVLARAGVTVSAGAFSVDGLDLRGGDDVTITPRGPVAPAAFGFRVPALAASTGAGGQVKGTATLGGAPVAGRVTLVVGATTSHAAVDPDDGAFAVTPDPAPAPGASGTIAWTTATPSAAVTTIARLGAGDGTSGGGTSGGGGTGGGGTGGGGTGGGGTGGGGATGGGTPGGAGGGTATGDPATTPPGSGSVPGLPGSGFSSVGPLSDVAAACRPAWLTRRGRPARRRFGLLGLRASAVQRCLGRALATSRAGAMTRWTMRGAVALRLRASRVIGFTLTSPAVGWRSAPDRAGIGSDRRHLETALGRLTRDGRALRAVLPLGSGRFADVRVTISRVRATQIAVDTLARDKLDRVGRALARRAP